MSQSTPLSPQLSYRRHLGSIAEAAHLPTFADSAMDIPHELLPAAKPAAPTAASNPAARNRRVNSLPYQQLQLQLPVAIAVSTPPSALAQRRLADLAAGESESKIAPPTPPAAASAAAAAAGSGAGWAPHHRSSRTLHSLPQLRIAKNQYSSLTQPASPTWSQSLLSSPALQAIALDDTVVTRSVSGSGISWTTAGAGHRLSSPTSLPLPSIGVLDMSDSPLPPASPGVDIDLSPAYDPSQPSVDGPTAAPAVSLPVRSARAWLLMYLVTLQPLLLALGCFSIAYHSCFLYASLYAAYLLVLEPLDEGDASPPFLLMFVGLVFLVLLVARSGLNLILCFCRVRSRSMWCNQRRHRHNALQRYVHYCNCFFYAAVTTLACLTLLYLAIARQQQLSQVISTEWILCGIVVMELSSTAASLLLVALLLIDFRWREVSLWMPYVPISSTFNSTAAAKVRKQRHRRLIDSLPIIRYGRGVPASHDDCCPICLIEFEQDDAIRALKCRHLYHQSCVDQWLEQKASCPMCIRNIELSLTRKEKRQHRQSGEVVPVRAVEMERLGSEQQQQQLQQSHLQHSQLERGREAAAAF